MNKNLNYTKKNSISGDLCENYKPDESCENLECLPNQYPGYLEKPMPMAIVGTHSGSYKSIYGLLSASLKCSDRILLMVPWGNYVLFKSVKTKKETEKILYFLHDGCTCNTNIFRYLDLREGTAGFLTFCTLNTVVCYILNSQGRREKLNLISKQLLDDICLLKSPMKLDVAPEGEEIAI